MMLPALLLAAAVGDACPQAVTQADLTRCAAVKARRAEEGLNRQWRATLAAMRARDARSSVDTGDKASFATELIVAERAWIAFRDANCRVEGGRMRGGSAEPMTVALCRATMARARTAELMQQGREQ